MHIWYTKNLGDAMLAGEQLDHIKVLFQTAYDKADNCIDMAVFIRHESEGRLHCEAKVYFSPAAAGVAAAAGAAPCQRPSAEGLGLLAGSDECWAVLFGATNPR